MKHFRMLFASLMVMGLVAYSLFGSYSFASAADNGTANGTATLNPGALTVISVDNLTFAGNLTANSLVLNSSFAAKVADPTENAAGWHLTASITALTKSGSVVLGANPKITAGVPTLVNGTIPTNLTSYGTGIGLSTTAASIFSADANTGMGQSSITFDASLAVPDLATSGAYTATLTVTIVAGP